MARKARKIVKSKTPARKTTVPPKKISKATAKAVAKTPVRNSAIPKVSSASSIKSARPLIISHEMISVRAFEISCGPNCGSEFDNWIRAERELRG